MNPKAIERMRSNTSIGQTSNIKLRLLLDAGHAKRLGVGEGRISSSLKFAVN